MILTETALPGVLLIETKVFGDARGRFQETYQAQRYREAGLNADFVQDNVSVSEYGVLRGLHLQNPNPQGKLVTVLHGAVYDVAVDVRPDSPQFGQWVSCDLTSENGRQLYIPPGFAHGFVVTGKSATFLYKCTDFYVGQAEVTVRWDDPDLGITWPVDQPLLNARDASAPLLRDIAPETLRAVPYSI